MIDRTTKTLLLAIALGLWVQIVIAWTRPVAAQSTLLQDLQQHDAVVALKNISDDTASIRVTVKTISTALRR